MGLTGLMVLLVVVALTAGLLAFGGAAGPLSWPLLGIFTLALLLLLAAALVAAAGGRELFR